MPYTREQAEKDREEMHRRAGEVESQGNIALAGVLRVEAENCLDRVDMVKAHCPNVGPYSATNPGHCVHCGEPWDSEHGWATEVCVPVLGLMPKVSE